MIDTEVWAGLPIGVKGDIYEGLLQKNAEDTKSGAGQSFTPRPLIHAIVEAMRPQPRQTVCDPACGTGGFLLAAHDYASNNFALDREQRQHLREGALHGWKIVDAAARLCVMNLYLHGVGGSESPVRVGDSLAAPAGRNFDVVLTNPPFVLFFDERPGREEPWTERLWIYERCRTSPRPTSLRARRSGLSSAGSSYSSRSSSRA